MKKTALVAAMKDEAPYILEWVAYHRAIGFSEILVVANDCSDGTFEILSRLEELGYCTFVESIVPVGKTPHSTALKIATAHPLIKDADFVVVLDSDEFLVVKTGTHKVNDLVRLMQSKNWDCMVLSWRLFGSNKLEKFEDQLVLKRFTRCSDPAKKQGVKTFFRKNVVSRLGIHFPRPLMKNGNAIEGWRDLIWVDGSGNRIASSKLSWNNGKCLPGREYAEIAHFMCKSLEEYLLKIDRGDGLLNVKRHGLDYWRKADKNSHADLNLECQVDEMMPILVNLHADKVLLELHENAVRMRHEKIIKLKETKMVQDILYQIVNSDQPSSNKSLQNAKFPSNKIDDVSNLAIEISSDVMPIHMNWFRRSSGTRTNFGDELGPYLVSEILDRPVKWAPVSESDIISIGSILSQSVKVVRKSNRAEKLVVWGTGSLLDEGFSLDPRLHLLALRGRLTGVNIGLQDDIAFGDPGILASKFIKAVEKKYRWGIVPHFRHRKNSDILSLEKKNRSVKVIDPTHDVEQVVRLISSCQGIISSSLHGLIVADSYNIPSIWLNIQSHKQHEFKFYDYCSGVSRPMFEQIDLGGLQSVILSPPPNVGFVVEDQIKDRLINVLLAAFGNDRPAHLSS